MDDRVGDILARRSATLETGRAAAVTFSLVLHGAIAAAAALAAMRGASPQALPVLNIQFAPIPASSTHAAHTGPAPAAAPLAPKSAAEVKPSAIEIPLTATTPVARPDPKATVPLSSFGKSTKKGSEHIAPPLAAPPAPLPGISTDADVPAGGTGVTALEGGDFPYTLYIDNMKRLVGGHWFRPQITGTDGATVRFVIERNGTIRDARTEISSGNVTFDNAALRSILEASPLPPLPFGYDGTFLGVHLKFK